VSNAVIGFLGPEIYCAHNNSQNFHLDSNSLARWDHTVFCWLIRVSHDAS
jgi:hypothetical protein